MAVLCRLQVLVVGSMTCPHFHAWSGESAYRAQGERQVQMTMGVGVREAPGKDPGW